MAASPSRQQQQPPHGYHYQRSPPSASSSSGGGPPVLPSGMPVNRSHLAGSPSKPTLHPASVVGKGTPGRRSSGHGLSRSLDVTPKMGSSSHAAMSSGSVNMADVERDFQNMMNVLEVPASVRQKMNTMEPHVKQQFLRNSQSFNLSSTPSRGPVLQPTLHGAPISAPLTANLNAAPSSPTTGRGPNGGAHVHRPLSGSNQGNIYPSSVPPTPSKKSKKATTMSAASSSKALDGPVAMARWLKEGPQAAHMDIAKVKKLRMLLRQETTVWIEVFLQERGYLSLLRRLSEVLEMEWREEQHDDQLLHELLRCIKALATSDIGCAAIRNCTPNPFIPLVNLLFTDKKPGDVPTRQLMTEIVTLLFDLYPTRPAAPRWPGDDAARREYIYPLPREYSSLPQLARQLLLGEDKDKDIIDFVTATRRPRVYKTYLTEISDVCRDYFWMFCHGNGIWKIEETDASLIERPMAPGGATGGVEYEAGNYLTAHFKLINAMARSCQEHNEPIESDLSAWRFHAQLFESGLDRIILASRKASTTYYPNLHLEIARYCALATAADYSLPHPIQRLIESPPSQYRRVDGQARNRARNQHLADAGAPRSPRHEAGRSSPAQSRSAQVDDRYAFQGQRPAGGRNFSPAPQITTAIPGEGRA